MYEIFGFYFIFSKSSLNLLLQAPSKYILLGTCKRRKQMTYIINSILYPQTHYHYFFEIYNTL